MGDGININKCYFVFSVTGVCQRQHKNILVALIQCKDLGTIKFDVPFKEYDYSDWNKSSESQKQ